MKSTYMKSTYRTAIKNLLLSSLALSPLLACAQERVEPIPFGDMDHWVERHVHESAIIGGNTVKLYELGPDQTVESNEPYTNLGGSPWGNSNIMAKVAGVVKTNNTVYPEARGAGKCARLETKIEKVKVLGIVDISVIAAGSMFLGSMSEPITSTRDAVKHQIYGIPYNKRPKALRYDYKLRISPENTRTRMTGFSRKSTVPGQDHALAVFYLQKRSEDSQGNITAKRVGTFAIEYDKSTDGWVNGATYPILYGDITSHPSYDEQHMGLQTLGYAVNSKGQVVEIQETGWAGPDEQPTHMMLQFTSSNGGAFVGTVGNAMWIDNVELIF